MQEQKETESTSEKVIKRFALLKFFSQRSMVYYQLITSFVIWVIFLREYDPAWWLYMISIIVLITVVCVIGYLDRRLKILEYEQTLYNNENKEISAILKTVNQIKDKQLLDELINKTERDLYE